MLSGFSFERVLHATLLKEFSSVTYYGPFSSIELGAHIMKSRSNNLNKDQEYADENLSEIISEGC